MQQRMIQAAINAPIAMPGTNPAAKDFPLKSESAPVAFGLPNPGSTPEFVAAEVGVEVPEPVADVAAVDVGVDCDTVVGAVRAMHWASLQL
jgi:hypothetical protein